MNNKDTKLLRDILGDATVFDPHEHTLTISCYEYKWDEDLQLNCLTYSPDNAKKLASVLQAIARNNRRKIDIYKPLTKN